MTTTAKAKHEPEFGRQRLPERICNLHRLLADMEARALDGLVVTTPLNVFWLTSFNGIAHKGDEPRPYVVILARREPEHPILVLADYYLTTPLHQPTWVTDIRPCRSVMAAMDRAPRRDDVDAHIPWSAAGIEWVERARAAYNFDLADQVRAAMKDLGLGLGAGGEHGPARAPVLSRRRARAGVAGGGRRGGRRRRPAAVQLGVRAADGRLIRPPELHGGFAGVIA